MGLLALAGRLVAPDVGEQFIALTPLTASGVILVRRIHVEDTLGETRRDGANDWPRTLDVSALWSRVRDLARDVLGFLPEIAVGLLVLAGAFVLGRLLEQAVVRLTERKGKDTGLGLALGRILHWAIVLVLLLIALTIVLPSFRPVDLIELLGIWSVAVGFAFKDILQNFLAGILILLSGAFRIGDQIVVDRFEGTIDEIQPRATLLRTYDGRRVIIPNAVLFTQTVTVNTAFPFRRSEYDFSIGYGDDPSAAGRHAVEAISTVEGVVADPAPQIIVAGLGPSGIILRAWWWTDSRRLELLQVQGRVLAAIRARLKQEGIDLPFPTQQILFHDQTEETDGNRARQREGWPSSPQGDPRPATLARAIGESAVRLRNSPDVDTPS